MSKIQTKLLLESWRNFLNEGDLHLSSDVSILKSMLDTYPEGYQGYVSNISDDLEGFFLNNIPKSDRGERWSMICDLDESNYAPDNDDYEVDKDEYHDQVREWLTSWCKNNSFDPVFEDDLESGEAWEDL
tara:strand:+ start:581 stop:970 length:390 start_codon:yes stop_codon:yes gene_type:complete